MARSSKKEKRSAQPPPFALRSGRRATEDGKLPLARVFTVSGFLDLVNKVLAAERDVFVQGEISSIQALPSGAYFSLKDKEDESILQCYMPPRAYHALGIELDEGLAAPRSMFSGHSRGSLREEHWRPRGTMRRPTEAEPRGGWD